MPTPVSTARQCLTGDAAKALDEAVAAARRRGHAQTTSLHAVTALLSSSSSLLRDACSRARSTAYSPRNQLRALDICFALSLDRLSSSSSSSTATQNAASSEENEPPISNSLMAAIKRSQANQRRNPPEAFHQHLQQNPCLNSSSSSSPSSSSPSSSTSLLSVKVELQPLILSILDDPGVSRVFADAGFRSRDVQMALLRPPPSTLLRLPRSRCPPLFLCNFTAGPNLEPGRPGFNFPFSGLSAFAGSSDLVDNCRRIGKVLVSEKSRNPLLVGVCAGDAVQSFAECLERGGAIAGSANAIPREITGLSFVWLEKWVSESSTGDGNSRFGELGQLAERCPGPGVAINVGDLNWLLADVASAGYMVAELTRLLDLHRGRLWLIGSAANYETYMKFLTRFPSVEKDWDLQLLPITSLTPAIGGGLHSRPQSLMESFVPFGGFFSSASDLKSPLTGKCQSISRCHSCDEKYEQELEEILKGCSVPVPDPSDASLPSWLCKADFISTKGLDAAKAKDDGSVLNAKVILLQKKWNDFCHRLHPRSQMLPSVVGLPYIAERKEMSSDCNNKSINASRHLNVCGDAFPASTDSLKIPLPDMNAPIPVVSESKNEELAIGLSLGMLTVPLSKERKEPTIPFHKERLPELDRRSPSRPDAVSGSLPTAKVLSTSVCADSVVSNSYLPVRTSPSSNIIGSGAPSAGLRGMEPSDRSAHFDPRDFKILWSALFEKVGRQDKALRGISQAIAHCKTGNERRRGASLKGDIWLNIVGPDRVGKKKIAMALAEILFDSKQNLIHVDLRLQDGVDHSNAIFELGQVMNGYDARFRGQTVVDHIAGEISKKPRSVVFLENVDKADLLLQTSLSKAIKTGKFPDSYGREIGINNAVFVTTTRTLKGYTFSDEKECVSFSEERILGAQSWQMKILVGYASEAVGSNSSNVLVSSWNEPANKESMLGQVFVNKRKLDSTSNDGIPYESLEKVKRPHRSSNTFLDLNLSAEEMEVNDASCGDDENDRISEHTEAWLEEFFDLGDETMSLMPFDFDSLTVNILKKISKSFQNTIGCKGLLEIDSKVMEQIVAAAWLSDGKGAIEDWVEQVLAKCFVEARERYKNGLSANSVLKLVALEECLSEEQAPGVCLPARIILH
eukprot:TRINITY_DN3112_c1_g1_i1.p1 TRINITY_DN3112_c1_g1~~TRINITY_DN3112_c1_g1_i1.p1  ORF type:complete len:1137 (+),score=227.46 TRINITY_DN3112_c1_g1_i1:305-3715(+)